MTIALIASTAISQAQSPKELVHAAFNSRDIIRSAKLLKQSATRTSDSLGAYPLTRIETAFGSSPDVQGGEDLTLFQPIDLFNKSRFGRATGKAGISQAQANLRQAYIDVQLEVLIAYANWNNARGLQKNAEDQLTLVKRMKEITDRRAELRAIPELQKSRADLEVEKQTQVLNDRKANAEAARVSLTQVVGSDFKTFDDKSTIDLQPDWIATTQVELSRPELLVIHSDIASNRADSAQARSTQLPDLELQFRRSPWSSGQEQYGARLQFVIPLWDHGASRNRANASDLKAQAAQAQYSDLLKKANAEVKVADIQLESAKKSVVAYTKLVEFAREFVAKSERGFELGASTLIDVLDAKRALSDATDSLANALLARDLAVTAGLKARGQLLEEPK